MNTQQTAKASTSNRAYWAQVVVLGLVVGLGLQFAQAWTAPTASAPNGNVSGPITTSSDSQNKQGILGVGGLGVKGAAVIDSTGSLKLTGKNTCDLKTDAAGILTCGTDAGITSITSSNNSGINVVTNGAAVTVNPNTSILQKRVNKGGVGGNGGTGICAVGQAISAISDTGSVTCVPSGGIASIMSRSQPFQCNRDAANFGGNKNGTLPCPVPQNYNNDASKPYQLCMLERTYASDGSNDINGFGCYLHYTGGRWTIETTAIGVQVVQCSARCFY